LEEKCEADPLIVFVKSDLIIVRVNIFHSGVSLGAPILICDTEGGMYPAVGVHHALRDLLHDAVYRVSDVGFGGHQGAGRQQDHEGGLVMKAEHIVIDANVIKFDVSLYIV